MTMTKVGTQGRLDWVDVAKGICIILVVMMHSTLGVEKAAGTASGVHAFIEWARPFRMPDFFLISGLFLAARIDRPWRAYVDTKIVHFAYFYVLWLNIQFLFKLPAMLGEAGGHATAMTYVLSYIEPFGTLWFIYLLALFFLAAKLLNGLPKPAILVAAALLHLLAPVTGWTVVDEFADRFVFFYTGYAAAPYVLALGDRIGRASVLAVVVGLLAWAEINWLGVKSGIALAAGPDLTFSFAGIIAVVATSVLLVRAGTGAKIGPALAYCGRNSIVIYLAFPLFMGPARVLLLKLGAYLSLDVAALATTAAAVLGALALKQVVKGTRFDILFVRANTFKLGAASRAAHSATSPHAA